MVQERRGRRATASLVTAVRASLRVESPVICWVRCVKWVRLWKREFAVALTLCRVEGRVSRSAFLLRLRLAGLAPVAEIEVC